MRALRIRDGGGSLTIVSDEGPEPLYWHVFLKSGGLSGGTDIDLDALRHRVEPVGDFFLGLAADWRGWQGARTWGDGPLMLSATHDGLGHVAINVRIRTNVYYEEDWEASATVTVEAGQLDHIAREAAQLPDLLPDA